MKNICVFCGSSYGLSDDYSKAAEVLGLVLVEKGIGLVYGGGNVGLMGEIAATVVKAGGEVTGVIPKALANREVAFTELGDLRIVDTMHERKALMAELSDGFIALPGGYGTLEEIFEVITWGQLAIHDKPCGLLNIRGYYDQLTGFLDHSCEEGFIHRVNRDMILVDTDAESLLGKMEGYKPAGYDKAVSALKKKREKEGY